MYTPTAPVTHQTFYKTEMKKRYLRESIKDENIEKSLKSALNDSPEPITL